MDIGQQEFYGNRLQDNKSPRVIASGATATLSVSDQVVLAAIPASASLTITLPPVLQARGKVYYIRCNLDSGGTSILVVGKGGVDYAATAITATTGFVAVMSTGDSWIELDFSAT